MNPIDQTGDESTKQELDLEHSVGGSDFSAADSTATNDAVTDGVSGASVPGVASSGGE